MQIRVPSKLDNTEYLTQNNGTPIYNNSNSTTVGLRGPVLYDDMHLVNKLGQFNREKIPERVVHARGMTAKGYFEVRQILIVSCTAAGRALLTQCLRCPCHDRRSAEAGEAGEAIQTSCDACKLQVQEDITDLSCADLFGEVGKRTPVATRFSTVTHERGSPESLRDVRGFSVSSSFVQDAHSPRFKG